jgi:proteasome regulatory subunit
MNVYEHIFFLEEQIRLLRNEKMQALNEKFQAEDKANRLEAELKELRSPPLIMGDVKEIVQDGKVIVRHGNGMEFMVSNPNNFALKIGQRVAMNQRNLSIIEALPEGLDYRALAMEVEERPKITFKDIGGMKDSIREVTETIILPLKSPKKFSNLGIKPPRGILLYGLPGTGKTLLAKAVAREANATFIRIVGSELVRKFIGEGAGLVRDIFVLAKKKKPAVIFIDEIDSIGALRTESISSGDREVQRTLMQLLAEMDGFDDRSGVKIIGATNRIDILDPALLRPGRFDRIIEIPLPNEKEREQIFKIHSREMNLAKDVDMHKLAMETEKASGADIESICIEAGMFALR